MTKKRKNIIFDFDSTLVTIEGIDELARFKNCYQEVESITERAMNGQFNVDEAFEMRLNIIQPTQAEVNQLATTYLQNITDGAIELIDHLNASHNIFVVTGGYRDAVVKTTDHLGIIRPNVFANELIYDSCGNFLRLDTRTPLWKKVGKKIVVEQIKKKFNHETIVVGDGLTDLEAAKAADKFICFAGVARRNRVIEKADYVVSEKNLLALKNFLN